MTTSSAPAFADGERPTKSPFSEQLPPGYPAELECELHLDDGRCVRVRPILPTDAPALADAIAHADPQTIRLRFLGGTAPHDDALVRYLVEVDYRWRLALVALDADGRGLAVARYEGSPGQDSAEVAVTVAPGWRRVGLGSRLLAVLASAAVRRGIRHLTAIYLVENHDVAGLVQASGLPHRTRWSMGVAETEIDLCPFLVGAAAADLTAPSEARRTDQQ